MFSTRKMKKVFKDLKEEINKIDPSADINGDVIDYAFDGRHVQIWVDQMNIETDIHNDMNTTSIPQLVDLNDLRWYALCKKLEERNMALRAAATKEEDKPVALGGLKIVNAKYTKGGDNNANH